MPIFSPRELRSGAYITAFFPFHSTLTSLLLSNPAVVESVHVDDCAVRQEVRDSAAVFKDECQYGTEDSISFEWH